MTGRPLTRAAAIDALDQFLAKSPNDPNAGAVARTLAELRAQQERDVHPATRALPALADRLADDPTDTRAADAIAKIISAAVR